MSAGSLGFFVLLLFLPPPHPTSTSPPTRRRSPTHLSVCVQYRLLRLLPHRTSLVSVLLPHRIPPPNGIGITKKLERI